MDNMQQITDMINASVIESSHNQLYSCATDSMINKLFKIINYLDMGSLPNTPCYLFQIPNELLLNIIDYITPRNICNTSGVCNLFNDIYISKHNDIMNYFTIGRVMYFALNENWVTGIIICIIDTINHKTFEQHNGFHVYTLGGNVTYYTNNDIIKYSRLDLPKFLGESPANPIITNKHAPYLNFPHQLCQHGIYTSQCNGDKQSTAPSTCNVLLHGFTPPIHDAIGEILDIETFPRHPMHLQEAYRLENLYGVAYTANGVRQQLYPGGFVFTANRYLPSNQRSLERMINPAAIFPHLRESE
jgi:hypothetical protein